MNGLRIQDVLRSLLLVWVGWATLDANSSVAWAQAASLDLTVVESNVAGAPPGTACRLGLLDLNDPSFNCRITVTCGNVVLYGDGSSGLNICSVDEAQGSVQASDASWTDGDPALTLAAQRSAGITVRVWTQTPSTESTTTRAPSVARSAAVT